MSRVGKHPVSIPANVQVTIQEGNVLVKGPLGSLESDVIRFVNNDLTKEKLTMTPLSDNPKDRAKWGMAKRIIDNMVEGVVKGYSQTIEIIGVGFKVVQESPKELRFSLGYSHDIVFELPEGITFVIEKPTVLVIKGIDKQKVGQIVGEIIRLRRRDPYKGKGLYRIAPVVEYRRSKEAKKK